MFCFRHGQKHESGKLKFVEERKGHKRNVTLPNRRLDFEIFALFWFTLVLN